MISTPNGQLDISSLWTVNMASSNKVLQFVRNYPSNHLRSKIVIVYEVQAALTIVAFLVFEAKSMSDYEFGICLLISEITSIIIYILLLCQSENTSIFFCKLREIH